jgi:integrase/recombinase XerC/integrase/recombinase XerD
VQGKGRDGKGEFVLLTKTTHNPLREYLSTRGTLKATDPLFASASHRNANQRLTTRSISRLVRGYLHQQGIANHRITAHSLRHTAITLALVGGATLQEAQALGRHASVQTALIYAHNLDRFNRAPERRVDSVLRECPQ